jgi:cephalosporin-C deacetylase-like acetyl esterase
MKAWVKFAAAVSLLLALPALAQPLNPFITFTPFHANGLYQAGERYGWTVRAPMGMSTQDPLAYDYVIRENNLNVIKSGTIDLSSGSAVIEGVADHPAMVYVRLTPNRAGMVTPPPPAPAAAATPTVIPRAIGPSPADLDKLTVGAAIDATNFKPSIPRPADFDAFWAGKLAALAQIPINPRLTPLDAPKPGIDFYKVQLDSVGSHVQGYLAAPKGGGKHPALILYQYAGVYALDPRTAADRAAEGWLAFNVDSHDQDPASADGAPRNYAMVGATDRETSYFLAMYLRDSRAIDYIRSRPDWDGKTIVVMGTSMGGQQSFAAAGLNPDHVTALVVNVPAGFDVNGEKAGRKTGYPGWPSDDAAIMQAGQYFDPVNFASKIKAKSVVAFGLIDTTSPPAGVFTAFNQIPAPKEAIPMVESDHNHITPQKQEAYLERQQAVLAQILKTGTFTPNADWAK